MKRGILLYSVALLAAVATSACSNDFEENNVEPQGRVVEIMAGIDVDSRTALGDESGETTPIYWNDDTSESFKLSVIYYSATDSRCAANLTFTKSEETVSSSYAKFATSTVVTAIDKVPVPKASDGPHIASYPAKKIDASKYALQAGTKEGLKDLNYMEAYLDNTTELEWDAIPALTFETKVAFVKMLLSHEDFVGQTISSVRILSNGTPIIQTSESFEADANGTVEVWFAIHQDNFTMENITISAFYNGGSNAYTATLGDKTLAAGKLYKVTKSMERSTEPLYNKTAEQAVTGDFAMKDGTFISGSAPLTSEQKANVAGVVFWTTKETDLADSSQILANLADDKVMAADYPNCTHGLIVALKNVTSSSVWQGSHSNQGLTYKYLNMECIWEKFQKTTNFNPDNKADYADLNVELGNTDNFGKILGYNNTKILEAYNAYCNANSKSAYVVKPVQSLATWAASNAAPANTTGWYLPSVKELCLMAYGDYDMVNGTRPSVDSTLSIIQPSISAAGGTKPQSYFWSSSEGIGGSSNEKGYVAWGFDMRSNIVPGLASGYKSNPWGVRAVCAF